MKALFRQLGPAFLPYRRAVAWGVACVVLTNLLALGQPQVLRFAVDDLYRGVTAEKLGRYAVILFAIAAVAGLFKFAMRIALLGVSRRIEYDFRNRLFERLLLQPHAYFQSAGVGDLVARSTSDLAAVRMMLGPGVMYLINTLVVTAASLAFMLSISPRLTLVALIPLPLTSLAMWLFGDRIHRESDRIQEQFSRLSARAQENISGVRVVRSLGREERECREFRELHEEYLRRQNTLTGVSSIFHPLLAFLSGLAALLGLFYGGRAVIGREITLGEFVAFTVYLGMLNWPMVALGWIISLFQRGAASFDRLREVMDAPLAAPPSDRPRPAAARGEVEIRNLTFTYPGRSEPALDRVSIRIRAGTTTAIVGPTGSGKSTLLGLLVRRFDPPAGTIRIDGVDVLDLDPPALRARFAVVPQEAFLFSATVAENIALGCGTGTPESLRDAASAAGLAPDLEAFPQGLETPAGERGAWLSGGQRQRVAIARALLRGAPLLLLDDSLASVDAETEAAILRGLRARAPGRTTVIVSHRAAAVAGADQAIVLEDGRVAEQGPPAELLRREGPYARWLRQQQLVAELEAS